MMTLIGRLYTTGSLAWLVPSVRPSWIPVGITTVSMAAGVGLFFFLLSKA